MKKISTLMKQREGFTLIELLVVIAIIAILALIVLLALNPVEMARRSRDSRRLSDLATLRQAIDLSTSDGETLVNTGANWITINTSTNVTKFPNGAATDTNLGKYLPVVPGDPYKSASNPQVLGVASSTCTGATGTPGDLIYQFRSDGNVYILRARLESEENCNAIQGDGNDDSYYEIGTAPGMTL